MEYKDFLQEKKQKIIESGFDINIDSLNNKLFDFQKYIIKKALKLGKYAIFADTGLGKTFMQIEWARHIQEYTQKPVLILAPLAVSGQTINEGVKFGISIKKYSCLDDNGIFITNYEQLDNIDCSKFIGIILDESSIIKNFDGKTKQKIINKFKNTPYKLACTATPSPNDPMELGNHAEFLDIMRYNEMLAMYFIHDGGNTSKWRLKGHAKQKFYDFVSTWAIMLMKPSDIGFNAKGYDLPDLRMTGIEIKTETPEGMLFGGLAVNATDYNRSLRETENLRIKKVLELIGKEIGKNQLIIWTKQNQEASKIYKELLNLGYSCRNVQGSDKNEKKENDLLGFANNEYQILVTKSQIAQFGLNYQNCNYQIFASVDFSFESTYQSIRRSYRFGQTKSVNVWLITTDRMINVLKVQDDKQKQFRLMQKQMTIAVNKNMNNKNINNLMETHDILTDNYKLLKGDNIKRSKEIKDNESDLIVFSPPFAELYTYSSHVEDMGNSKNYKEFEKHFKYLIPELSRVLKQGRICAVHCMDLPIQKGKEGYIGIRDFSGMLIKWFQDCGFIYHSRVTIWKDPVIEMQRTKALGLLHKQVKKDSSMSRVGIPDYILIFRNSGDNEIPIKNTDIPVDLWQKIASPIWYDIDYSRTLNYRLGKANDDEKHICPLQLDTIERLILLYSNEHETVYSPFGGIGSEGYQALKMNRKSISIELKDSYFNLNCKNHRNALEEKSQLILL